MNHFEKNVTLNGVIFEAALDFSTVEQIKDQL